MNMTSKVPMTVYGIDKLREELTHLKTVMRPQVIEAIAEARKHGDLRENAEYHAAKDQQGFIEARIRDIEAKLSMSHVIDISKIENTGKIIFGSTVKLLSLLDNKAVTYQIVGDDEADLKVGKISVNSPIARALIGKFEGDTAIVKAPSGDIDYEIAAVEYI